MQGLFGAKTKPSTIDMAVRLVVLLILAMVGCSVQDSRSSCGNSDGPVKVGEDILSPGYPQPMQNGMECIWTVQAKAGRHIKLRGSKLDIGGSSGNCEYGALSVYDGCGKDRFLVENVCSSKSTSERNYLWISWGSCLTVQFTATTGSTNKFLLVTEDVSDSCGGKLLTSNQTFSPRLLPYPETRLCVWIIDAQQTGKSIELRFDGDFDIGRNNNGDNCDNDFVKVKGGRFSSSKTLGTYCGNTRPYTLTFQGRYLRVAMFRGSNRPSYTFTAHYSFLNGERQKTPDNCDTVLVEKQGQIVSPGYPQQYPAHLQCIWTIKLPKEDRVKLKFVDFDLEGDSEGNCPDDYVVVHNGPASWSPTIGRFCGKTQPRLVQSDSNEMRVVFSSNEQYGGKGFKATYEIFKESDTQSPSTSHFTGIMIGTTCGIIFVVLSALAMFHTRKMRQRRAQTWQADRSSTQSFDVHRANAPPDYDTVMASPEMFPSNPRQSCRTYAQLPHFHREESHLLGAESDEEGPPPYEVLEQEIRPLGRDNSVPRTEPTGEDQPGSKEEEHLPAVWYKRSSTENRKGRPSLGEQDPDSHVTTDV